MDKSYGLDRVEAARAELREEVEAALERGNKAQAFLELVEDVRGEGASKGGVVRVSVDSSGMPISVVVDGFPKLGGAFIEAFRRAVQDWAQALLTERWTPMGHRLWNRVSFCKLLAVDVNLARNLS